MQKIINNYNSFIKKFYNENCKYNMCAILHNKSKIYYIGYNKFIGHINIFGKKMMLPSRHAEMDVISKLYKSKKNLINKIKKQKLNLIVIRYTKKEIFGNSKPCNNCIKFMKSSGLHLKKITYYEDNMFKTTTLRDLENDHMSSGWELFYE